METTIYAQAVNSFEAYADALYTGRTPASVLTHTRVTLVQKLATLAYDEPIHSALILSCIEKIAGITATHAEISHALDKFKQATK